MTKAANFADYGLGVGIQSAGSVISGVGVTQLNFIGTGNTFRVSGGTVDISIQGGGGIGIQSAGTQIGTGVTQLNFIGTGNTFRLSNGTVDVSISGGGSGVSTTGVTTAAFFANPQYITTSYTLNSPNTNYGVFGPIYVSVGSTITVGVGNTLAIL
jgi:hypothetical protein